MRASFAAAQATTSSHGAARRTCQGCRRHRGAQRSGDAEGVVLDASEHRATIRRPSAPTPPAKQNPHSRKRLRSPQTQTQTLTQAPAQTQTLTRTLLHRNLAALRADPPRELVIELRQNLARA